jgi:hypothetical protein
LGDGRKLIGRFRFSFVTTLCFLGLLALASCGQKPLLYDVKVAPDHITPNADGDTDITLIEYGLGRNADLSIYFIDEEGTRHYFREREPRAPREDYRVFFSGVVDDRLLPDGTYTWVIAAEGEGGERTEERGQLTISEADSAYPEISQFTVSPPVFTPNRDGLSDRVRMNLYVEKGIESLQVYLEGENGERFPVEEEPGLRKPEEAGLHTYDYDAGVDRGAEPPPDGVYTVFAVSQDKVGQRHEVTNTLTIEGGGVPKAEILQGTVEWSTSSVLLGQTLCFTLTVDNYGPVPIRTSGPPPGTLYESDQNFNTLGYHEESGAWRVGINFDTSIRDYPFRWAVGEPEQLVTVERDGQTFYYLPSGTRGKVHGCVRILEEPPRNPLYFWAGLIHEDVEISNINNRVDPEWVEIQVP